MSACWVLPLGLGLARRPIARKGSLSKSVGDAAVKGSRRAAAFPRCDSTMRSPLAMRCSTPLAFFRNSSMVTVFMWLKFTLNLTFYQCRASSTLISSTSFGATPAAFHSHDSVRSFDQRPAVVVKTRYAWLDPRGKQRHRSRRTPRKPGELGSNTTGLGPITVREGTCGRIDCRPGT